VTRFAIAALLLVTAVAAFADPPQAFTLNATGICSGDHPAILLQWTTSGGAASYDITRDNLPFMQGLSSDANSFLDESNDVGTQHSYIVTAFNEEGSTKSNTASASAPASLCTAPPSAPTLSGNASCSNGSPRRPVVTLNWTASSGATSYAIIRNSEVIATTSSTSASDFTVATGTTYTYVVRAINSGGSADSNQVSIGVAFDICGLPPGAFSISTTAGCTAGNAKVTVAWSPSSGVTSYTVFRNSTALTTLPSTAQTYDDTTVAGDIPYAYSMRASNDSGTTDSNTSTITVPEGLCGNVVPTAPNVTASLFCSTGNTPAVRLEWTASQGATSYIVVRDGSPVTQLEGSQATTYEDTNVVAGKSYTYQIRAANPGAAATSTAVTIAVKASVCSPISVNTVALTNSTVKPGDSVGVSFNVTNRGGVSSSAATVTIRIGTLVVATVPVSPISSGTTAQFSQQITIPSLGSGVYFLVLTLSDDDANPATSPALTVVGIPSRRRAVSH